MQMAEIPRDTALQLDWVDGSREHVLIVIAFENQGIAVAQHINDVLRNRPAIGKHPEAILTVGEGILNRFTRIVRNRKGMNFQATDGKGGMAVNQATFG